MGFHAVVGTPVTSGVATITPTLPTWTAGDLVLTCLYGKYGAATVPAAPSGWTLVASVTGGVVTTGTDVGNSFLRVYGRIMQAGDTAVTYNAGATAPNSWGANSISYTPAAGNTWYNAADLSLIPRASASDTTSATPLTGAGAFNIQPLATQGATLVAFGGIPTDAGTSAVTPVITNVGITGGTSTSRAYTESSVGADSAGMVWDRVDWTGTATGNTTMSITTNATNNYGPVLALWLREINPTTPPVATVSTSSGTVTNVPTTGDYSYSFSFDIAVTAWKIKVVPNSSSPHTAGYQVESGGAVAGGTPITGTISWQELQIAGQHSPGAKVVKFFGVNAAGVWSGGTVPSMAAYPSLLRVSDGILVDENDAPIGLLKGFNTHVAPTVGGETFSWPQEHFTSMADAGTRIVRLVLHWDVFQKSAGLGGIDMTAIGALDATIAKCAAVDIYCLLSIHLNVSRSPAWVQVEANQSTFGTGEWAWLCNWGEDLVKFLADRYGNPSSPYYTKTVIALCPNEPPITSLSAIINGFERIVPWYRDLAPGWLIWVAPTAYSSGTMTPTDGRRTSMQRFLALDTNHRGVVCVEHDYFVRNLGGSESYMVGGPIWPTTAGGTAEFTSPTLSYADSDAERASQVVFFAPWVAWKALGRGRVAFALEEFGSEFTVKEGEFIRDSITVARTVGTVAEIWWLYSVASRAEDAWSARSGGIWRPAVWGWLTNPDPPTPISSLALLNGNSRAEADDVTSYTATGTSSWSHTPAPVAECHGVVVAILQPLSAADEVSTVTYGGSTLTRILSTASASARVYLYFLGVAVADDTQTVAMTTTGTAAKQAHCYTFMSDGRDMVIDTATSADLGTIANPSLTVTFTASLPSQVSVCAHCYGGALPPSQTGGAALKADINIGLAHDPGAATGETTYRAGDPELPSVPFGYDTLASAANLMGVLTVKEKPPDTPIGSWTNYITDPSFEGSNANGFWNPINCTLTFPTGISGTDRTKACRITATTAGPVLASPNTMPVEAGWTYTYMMNMLTLPGGRTFRLAIDWKDSTFTNIGSSVTLDASTTGVARLQAVAPTNATWCQLFWSVSAGGVTGDIFEIDAVQLTQGVYAGSYFDGATSGASWSGTADNSTSFLPV